MGVGQKRFLILGRGPKLLWLSNEQLKWILPGFVVIGGITELGAKVKAGKTTLIMKLVRADGGGSASLASPH